MTRQEAAFLARQAKQAKAPSLQDRFWSKVERGSNSECWSWKGCVRRKDEGYGAFWLNKRHQPASRIAWILTNGEIIPGLVVCHTCDNPRCCNPHHLFLGTHGDNAIDSTLKGRKRKIYTAEQIVTLRSLAGSIGVKKAAEAAGIKWGSASHILRRDIWRHV